MATRKKDDEQKKKIKNAGFGVASGISAAAKKASAPAPTSTKTASQTKNRTVAAGTATAGIKSLPVFGKTAKRQVSTPASTYLTGASTTKAAPSYMGGTGGATASQRANLRAIGNRTTVTPQTTKRAVGGFAGTAGNGTARPRTQRQATSIGDLRRQSYEQDKAADLERLTENSFKWHNAPQAKQAALKAENDAIRSKYGLTLGAGGVTLQPTADGGQKNLSELVQRSTGAKTFDKDSFAQSFGTYADTQEYFDALEQKIDEIQEKYPFVLARATNDQPLAALPYFATNPGKIRLTREGKKAYDAMSAEERADAEAIYKYYQELYNERNALSENGGGAGFHAANIGLGALGTVESAARGLSGYTDKLLGDVAKAATGGNDNAVSKFLHDQATLQFSTDKTGEARDALFEQNRPVGSAAGAAQFGYTAGRMLPSIAANAAVPGAGLAAIGTSAAKDATNEALQGGAPLGKAAMYGMLSGGVEVGTEKLFGGIPGLPKGIADSAIGKVIKSRVGQFLVDTLGEGAEEAIATAVDPILRRMTWDADAPNATIEQIATDAAMGAALSLVMGGGNSLAGGIANARYGSSRANNAVSPVAAQVADTAAQTAQDAPQSVQAETVTPVQQNANTGDFGANAAVEMARRAVEQQQAVKQAVQAQTVNTAAQTAQDAPQGVQAETVTPTTQNANTGDFDANAAVEPPQTMAQTEQATPSAQTAQQTAAVAEQENARLTQELLQMDKELQEAKKLLPGQTRDLLVADITERMGEITAQMRENRAAYNPFYGMARAELESAEKAARTSIALEQERGNTAAAEQERLRHAQIVEALQDAENVRFKAGDRVFALDRNNFGDIVRDNGDGTFAVHFVNSDTGAESIVNMRGDAIQTQAEADTVRQYTPQEIAERTGEFYDYSPEEFEKIIADAPDQNAPLTKRDTSRFGNSKIGLVDGDVMRAEIDEMTALADQSGIGQIIPPSVAMAVEPVHGAYQKTLERVLDQAAGKSKTVRDFLRDEIERPLAAAKGQYARNIVDQLNHYYAETKAANIRAGSKESAAVMWYGEGKRMDAAGDYVDYTLDDLKRDFPKNWKDIVRADAVNREMYDAYIEKIQQSRRAVYPYAEQRVADMINRRRASAAALSNQIAQLDAAQKAGTATPQDMESRASMMRELQAVENDIAQRIKDRDSGKAFANQRLFPRKDYYHHAMEMAEGFAALRNIIETDADIDPRLVGTSDNTKPNAKWSGILQKRNGVATMEDSVACMISYIPQAEFMINIDPQIARLRAVVRDMVDATANADRTNANSLIEWLTDYTNDLAGKTNPFDRAIQKFTGRKAFRAVEWINGRAKSNAILANINSAIAQVYNLPNGIAYIKNPRDFYKGMEMFAAAKTGDTRALELLRQSSFMTERYMDKAQSQFDEGILKKPKKFATWLLTVGDEQVAQMIWYSAYEQGVRKGVQDPVFYADDITKRSVAGRGVGEVPIMQKSKIVKLIAPFQVEVTNAYQLVKEKVGQKDALGLIGLFLSTFLLNEPKEKLTGTRTGFDLLDALRDGYEIISDPDYEGNILDKIVVMASRAGGELASNMPFGAQIASALVPDETKREQLFGETDPTRFGTGNIGINAIGKPITQLLTGETMNPWDLATGILLPWGGKQVSRAVDTAEDYGILPKFRVSMRDGVTMERQNTDAVYSEDGKELKFVLDKGIDGVLKNLAFGRYATDEGKAYLAGETKALNEEKTDIFKRGVTERGIDEATLYDAILKMGQAETVKDADGKTVQSKKDVARQMLFDRADLTADQKAWLDQSMLASENEETPVDYTDKVSFTLSQYTNEDRRAAAETAVSHGVDIEQFVEWDNAYSALKNEKGADDKAARTPAEARRMAVEELNARDDLSDGQKQAIADYVIISTMSDTDREKWEDTAKGKVNATDYIAFKAEISEYDNWAKGSGTDNAGNVAKILSNNANLDDNQRDALFQTYSSNMSKNPFHVSTYEAAVDQTGEFYSSLTDDGRLELRSLLNDYEQDIAEEKELSSWKAKAYMAEREAGIAPGTYAMFRVAMAAANTDGNSNYNKDETAAAVRALDGLTQTQQAYLFQSQNSTWKDNPFGSATVNKYSPDAASAVNPVAGTVSSTFGPRSAPTAGASTWHKAIDIAANAGTPVTSIKPGVITSAGWVQGYGVTVHVDHGDGTESEYHHMENGSIDGLEVGQQVTAGQQIGRVGSTGISTGAHLDFQTWKDGKLVDPLTVIPGYGQAPSGYVYEGSSAASTIASGNAGGSSSGSGGSKSNGFKSLPKYDGFGKFSGFKK